MSVAGSGQLDGSDARAAGAGDDVLRASFDLCRRIARRRARNFYYGLKLTPEPRRSALYAVYAFMRACDDLADRAVEAGGIDAGLARIEHFRQQMHRVMDSGALPDEPQPSLWPAFRHVVRQYPIDSAHLDAMLDGQCDDMVKNRYETFADLEAYCYKVASVVGLVCISVWGGVGGPPDKQTQELAEARGVALQLTNILRDVHEDARRDRVYLPADDLAAAGLDAESFKRMVLDRQPDERFDRLMAVQIDRARRYYERSDPLESRLDPACRPTAWAIMRIYRGLLDKIARDPRQVLRKRVRLHSLVKFAIAFRAMRGRLQG